MTRFRGAYTALVTPFRNDAIDETALRELVEQQIAAKIDGLVPCGTTGETPCLSPAEQAHAIRIVVEQAKGRVPVVAGAGSNSTAEAIELCRLAKDAGADGLLLVCPYYNRPTQAGLEAHFRAVLAAVPMPTLLYNIPIRTGVDLATSTLERLADIPSIVGIKEATGNVLRAQEIVARTGDRFDVLSGDDALTLAMLAVGGVGVVSVASNVAPREVADVVRLFRDGQPDAALALTRRLQPLYEALFVETNPIPVKAAVAMKMNLAKEIRLPLLWASDATVETLRKALASAGVS